MSIEDVWPALRLVPTQSICTDNQAFTLRTYDGIQLYQFPPSEQLNWRWTREQSEVSICEVTAPNTLGDLRLTPWLHWIDCWDDTGQVLYWSGPILRVGRNRSRIRISARDVGALMSRTRGPIEKQWDSADPAEIAGEMWAAMIAHHNLNATPIVLPDPRGDRFDFTANAEEGDMDAQINKLVQLGLRWSVVAGVPVLGPVSLKATVALGEEHFIGDAFEVVRDGTDFCNDVLLRAAGAKSYGRVEAGGLQFQKTVTIDSIDGVSNADRAAQQYVQYTGAIRDAVTMPEGAVLHPEAPLTIMQLMPSARVNVDADGLLATMEVRQVSVNRVEGRAQVAVKLESVNDDLPELLTIESAAGNGPIGQS